jgi:ATP-dependent RNA helicase DeaD
VGRNHAVRPADLVGAITAEAGVRGDVIGAIEISDRFSFVEVLESEVDRILLALKRATIRGQKVTASRYRSAQEGRG